VLWAVRPNAIRLRRLGGDFPSSRMVLKSRAATWEK
jgi:hypothetical protein